LKKQL